MTWISPWQITGWRLGNSPSPAVATYELRKSVSEADDDLRNFVNRNFYVDDDFSCPDEMETADLVKRIQQALMEGGHLRPHKIASNSNGIPVITQIISKTYISDKTLCPFREVLVFLGT